MGEKKDKKKDKTPKKETDGEHAIEKQLNISIIAKPLADEKLGKKVCIRRDSSTWVLCSF